MEHTGNKYVKRAEKHYSISFKLAVVREYEETRTSLRALQRKYGIRGNSTVKRWIEKYANFDLRNRTCAPMEKSREQELRELREKVRHLEVRNARLEKELEKKEVKAGILDLMIEMAEKEYRIDIRKNSFPGQSTDTGRRKP